VATLREQNSFHEGQFEGRRVKLPVFLGRRPAGPADEELRAFNKKLLQTEISFWRAFDGQVECAMQTRCPPARFNQRAGGRVGQGDLMHPAFHPKATIAGYCFGVEYSGSISLGYLKVIARSSKPKIYQPRTPPSPHRFGALPVLEFTA
jgi:hypothetical protein